MGRNNTLVNVRQMVKAESGKNLDSASTAQDGEINQIISDCQYTLASTYDFPFLKNRWDSTLVAGTRYQTFPTVNTIGATVAPNFERPMLCWVKWNAVWMPAVYGIDEYPEFNYLDSDRGQVLDPVQRWQFDDETKFEVWPIPASAASLRFVGQRALSTLYSSGTTWDDTKTLDLDDLLVAYFAAAEYLLREENPKAKYTVAKAQQKLLAILGAYPKRTETYCIGRGTPLGRKTIRNIPLVLVGGK